MRRLWLRWVGLAVFVALLAAVFIRLGEWQLHRLDQRKAANARVQAYTAQPAKDWSLVFTGPITEEMQWQKVTVTGTYSPAQLRARYRSVNDQAGSEVLTVLTTADGRTVLIDRGFLPTPKNTPEAVMPAPPTGEVTVTGYVRRSENGKPTATKPVEGNVRLINIAMINSTLDLKLADGYIQLLESSAPQPGLTLVPPPTLDEGPHLSYAVQWFIFTVIALSGAVILVRGDLKEKKRRAARIAELQARAAAPASPSDAPVAVTPDTDPRGPALHSEDPPPSAAAEAESGSEPRPD